MPDPYRSSARLRRGRHARNVPAGLHRLPLRENDHPAARTPSLSLPFRGEGQIEGRVSLATRVSVVDQQMHQARGVPAVAAAGLDLGIELVDQSGERAGGRRCAWPRPGRCRDPCASNPRRSRNRTCRRAWSTPGSPSARLWAAPLEMVSISLAPSSPARAAKFSPRPDPGATPAMQIWLTILASWPEPWSPSKHAGAGIGVDHRLGAVEGGLLAADHHRQLAVLGARLPAGDRRIEKIDAGLLGLLGDLAGDLGRGRRMVDQHRALVHARRARPSSP